jgi:hypothetical protein
MKKASFVLTFVLAGFFVAGIASATAPTVVLDAIGPLEYATFPQVYNVTGMLSHSPNISSISELKLFINDVQEGPTLDPEGTDTSAAFSLPWNILGPGTYTVKVTARHGSPTDGVGSDEEEVVVSEIVLPPVVIDLCPAAPSIAAHYLQGLGIKSGSKLFKNVISLVAGHMGPQTYFDGVAACDAGYAGVVEAYTASHMSVAK